MKIKEIKLNEDLDIINNFTLTGKIISNKENVEFGDSLYAIYPFGSKPVLPLVIENSTTHQIETDDGAMDTKKYLFNVNLYDELIDKVTDSEDFYVGCRVKVDGYLISKNFCKTEERIDLMNICNRYKNLFGEKPISYKGNKPFIDKETGTSFSKFYINWDALLCEGLLENIPDEEDQEYGRIEYFITDEGKVFKQEFKTNYIVIAKSIEPISDFVDITKGDINIIELSGQGKDIYTHNYDSFETGHICLINKSADMTRNSYIHIIVKSKSLERIRSISSDDFIKIKGKVKHRIIDKSFVKKKGKKEIVINHYLSFYEVDCKDIVIYKK